MASPQCIVESYGSSVWTVHNVNYFVHKLELLFHIFGLCCKLYGRKIWPLRKFSAPSTSWCLTCTNWLEFDSAIVRLWIMRKSLFSIFWEHWLLKPSYEKVLDQENQQKLSWKFPKSTYSVKVSLSKEPVVLETTASGCWDRELVLAKKEYSEKKIKEWLWCFELLLITLVFRSMSSHNSFLQRLVHKIVPLCFQIRLFKKRFDNQMAAVNLQVISGFYAKIS